jgi:thiol:disulfide interchange protein
MPMTAVTSVLALIVVGAALWLLNNYLPLAGNMKKVVNIVLVLIVVGIALWLINTYVPMAGSIKTILNIVVVIATCVGVLQAVGLWGGVVKLSNEAVSSIKDHTGSATNHTSHSGESAYQPTPVLHPEVGKLPEKEYQLPDGSRMRSAEASTAEPTVEMVPASKDERAG